VPFVLDTYDEDNDTDEDEDEEDEEELGGMVAMLRSLLDGRQLDEDFDFSKGLKWFIERERKQLAD